jgi:RNA polymerase sigma-70 factor (family 1)
MDYGLLAEHALLKLLKASDQFAFREIYVRYWKKLYFLALSKINSREIAEDIVQNVFTDIWEKRTVHHIENISSYLTTAIRYQTINYIKSTIFKQGNIANSTGQKKEENTAEMGLLVQELNTAIDRALRQLPHKTQTVFRLSRFEKRSNKDISHIMDLSEKSVEYHITQSLKLLRIHLRDFNL